MAKVILSIKDYCLVELVTNPLSILGRDKQIRGASYDSNGDVFDVTQLDHRRFVLLVDFPVEDTAIVIPLETS